MREGRLDLEAAIGADQPIVDALAADLFKQVEKAKKAKAKATLPG